jgi:hypothetical protein
MNRPNVTAKPSAGTGASGPGLWPPLFLLLTAGRKVRRSPAAPERGTK